MGVGKFFSREEIVDFSRWWPNAFFQGWANSGEISFYQLESKRRTFFYSKVNRKISRKMLATLFHLLMFSS